MSMPDCTKEAVFAYKGGLFQVTEAGYSEDADMATLSVKRVGITTTDTNDVDLLWLGNLAWLFVEDMRSGGRIPWKNIEIHTGAPTPCIIFCAS